MDLWSQSAMEESDCKLSQPTVFALTFLLLIVMNLGQVWCNEEIRFLFHSYSQKYLTMHDNGSVRTLSHSDGTISHQCLRLKTVRKEDDKLILSIYNPATKRFLCFNRNKTLVGRKRETADCHFYEQLDDAGFHMFRSFPRQLTVAFSMKGRPQKRRNKKNTNAQFMTINNGKCVKPHPEDPLDPSNNETDVSLRHKNKKHKMKHKAMV